MNGNEPVMLVIAGPSGSGKSTITEGLSVAEPFPARYINADETVLSIPGKLALFDEARDRGFSVNLLFITNEFTERFAGSKWALI